MQTNTIVLPPLKIVRSIGTPDKRMRKDFCEVSRQCLCARNAITTEWYVWRVSHDWQPDQIIAKDGTPKVTTHGEPWLKNQLLPINGVTPQTMLYRWVRSNQPQLHSAIDTCISKQVYEHLTSKTPYNHEGVAVTRAEAVLRHEIALPSFRDDSIPIPSKTIASEWIDCLKFQVPLWSLQSGRRDRTVWFEVAAADLRTGHKTIIRDAIERVNGCKFGESKIYQDKGNWYLRLTVSVPVQHDLAEYKDSVLTLTPSYNQEDRAPFVMQVGESIGRIAAGQGKSLVAEYERCVLRKKQIGSLSRAGVRAGRGKRRFYELRTRDSRRFKHVQQEVRRDLVRHILTICEQRKCGTIHYANPKLGERKRTWFALHGQVPWDWERFLSELSNAARRRGVEVIDVNRKKGFNNGKKKDSKSNGRRVKTTRGRGKQKPVPAS